MSSNNKKKADIWLCVVKPSLFGLNVNSDMFLRSGLVAYNTIYLLHITALTSIGRAMWQVYIYIFGFIYFEAAALPDITIYSFLSSRLLVTGYWHLLHLDLLQTLPALPFLRTHQCHRNARRTEFTEVNDSLHTMRVPATCTCWRCLL